MANLLGYLLQGLGNLLASFFEFLTKPIAWVLAFLDGIFYAIYKLAQLLVSALGVGLAFFQLILATAAGLIRTVQRLATWSGTPLQTSYGNDGLQVLSHLLAPIGGNTVLPLLLLAVHVFVTAYLVIWLVGARKT